MLKHDPLFRIIKLLFIAYLLVNWYTSGTSSGGVVYELNILLTVEQMISILFGTVVLFTIFSDKLNVHTSCKSVIFRLNMSIMVILTAASLWINVITTGQMFRAIRKFKQGIYNVALTFFIIVGMIYIKGNQCQLPDTNLQ